MSLYRLEIGESDQWYLQDLLDEAATGPRWTAISGKQGHELDPRILVQGERVEVEGAKLAMRVGVPGQAVDFAFGPFLIPIVSQRVGSLIERLAPGDVQRIPVTVKDIPDLYEILNVTTKLDCIDTHRTVGEKWTAADHRADLAGQWRGIYDLYLLPTDVGVQRIFRVAGWTNALIVTEDIRAALGAAEVEGLSFRLVS